MTAAAGPHAELRASIATITRLIAAPMSPSNSRSIKLVSPGTYHQSADADAGPDDQLDHSTQPLAEGHIERPDGRDRREPRRAVPEEMHGDEPREARGQGHLDQGAGNASPAAQSPRKALAKTRPGRGSDRHAIGTGRTPPRFQSRAINLFLRLVETAIGPAASQYREGGAVIQMADTLQFATAALTKLGTQR